MRALRDAQKVLLLLHLVLRELICGLRLTRGSRFRVEGSEFGEDSRLKQVDGME